MKEKEAYGKWLSTKTVEDRNIYEIARRRVQEDTRTSKNLFWEKTTDQINTCAEDAEEFMSSNDRTQEDTNRHMTLVEQPEISTENVRVALSNMKNGKAPWNREYTCRIIESCSIHTTI
ncbi:hypothetical protein HHI36_002735 [Cryptolaemus montrouzieri]|uniref:Uncharacterized protein n=1 Tax=Cryptolaemus montrouzieri TaxID=559131 RepID=A0ABD2PBW5_9CUCU